MKKFLLFIALSFGFIVQSFASHIAGGNITYNCLGGDQYEVSLVLYYDCSSSFAAPTAPSININGCGTNSTLGLTLISTEEVSNVCWSEVPNTTCNGGSIPGYQEITYTGIVNLADCDCYTLSYSLCCRNPSNNLSAATGQNFYIESELCNQTGGCHSSPQFFNPFPLPYYCIGQTYSFNLGVFDLDGDSLNFSLTNTLGNNGNNIGYQAGFSAAQPIPGMTIDQFSGQITFTPTQVGTFNVTVLVEKYDENDNLIGTVLHDMQIVIQNCPPNAVPGEVGGGCQIDPSVGSSATLIPPNTIEICQNDDFCFSLDFADSDPGDSLYISSNIQAQFPGTTITYDYNGTTNEVTATICGTVPATGPSSYYIVFNMVDNFCPFPNTNTYLVTINTIPNTSVSDDVTICLGESTQLEAEGGTIFTWTVLSGEPINVGTNFSCNPCENPEASPSITTTYLVTSDLAGSACENTDTVTVTVAPDFTTAGYTVNATCVTTNLQLDDVVTGPAGTYTYNWDPATYLNDPTLAEPIANFGPQGTYEYEVTVTNAQGCVKTETVTVIVGNDQQPDVSILGNDTTLCIGQTLPGSGIMQGVIDGGAGNVNDFTWTWTPAIGLSSPNSHTTNANPTQTTTYILTAVSTSGNCQDSDTITINVVNVNLLIANVQHVTCFNGVDGGFSLTTEFASPNLINEQADSIVISSPTGQDQTLLNPNVFTNVSNLSAGFWTVTVYTNSGCSFSEVIQITQPPAIVTTLTAGMPSCHQMNLWDGSVNAIISGGTPGTGATPYTVNWYFENTTNPSLGSNNQITSLEPGDYIIVVEDGEGCQRFDTVTVTRPDQIAIDSTVIPVTCPGNNTGAIIVSNIQNAVGNLDFNWVPNGETSQSIENLFGGNYSLTITDANGCIANFSFVVPEPAPISLQNTTVQNSDCFSGSNGNGQVSAQASGGWTGNFTFQWSNAADTSINSSNPTWGNRPPGDYILIATDDSSCVVIDTFTVGQNPVNADFTATPQTGLEPLDVVFTNNSTQGTGFFYIWNYDNGGSSFLTTDPDTLVGDTYMAGVYSVTLIVGNGNGCYDTAVVMLDVRTPLEVVVPNVFTPNNDNVNDYFTFIVEGVSKFKCVIYDRWGKEVYTWEDHTMGWDGRRANGNEAPDGVYFYMYEIDGEDGTSTSGHGNVHLKR